MNFRAKPRANLRIVSQFTHEVVPTWGWVPRKWRDTWRWRHSRGGQDDEQLHFGGFDVSADRSGFSFRAIPALFHWPEMKSMKRRCRRDRSVGLAADNPQATSVAGDGLCAVLHLIPCG